MSMMDEIIENQVIGRIARAFEPPPCGSTESMKPTPRSSTWEAGQTNIWP